jgi:integrase
MLQPSFAAQECAPAKCSRCGGRNIHLNGTGGLIRVTEGKTKAARRMLPMVPAVYAALTARHEGAGRPEEGWLFPSTSAEGHLNKDTAKDQHKRALDRANVKAKAKREKEIAVFQPYVLRHTALTQLAEAGCDVFTLARIAGHSSITITQRYVHPQADAIDRAFRQTPKAALLALPAAGD